MSNRSFEAVKEIAIDVSTGPKGPTIFEYLARNYGSPEAVMSTASMLLGILPATPPVRYAMKALGAAVAGHGLYSRFKAWQHDKKAIEGGKANNARTQLIQILRSGVHTDYYDSFNPGKRISSGFMERLLKPSVEIPCGVRHHGLYAQNEQGNYVPVTVPPERGEFLVVLDNGEPTKRMVLTVERSPLIYGDGENIKCDSLFHTCAEGDEYVKVLLEAVCDAIAGEVLASLRLDENTIYFSEGSMEIRPRATPSGNVYPEMDSIHLAKTINSSMRAGKRHGVILGGPPGTGKSSLIKDLESLIERPVVHIPGDYFSSSYRLSQAMKVVEKVSPCCIVIEEFDRVIHEVEESGDISISGILGMLDGVHTESKNVLLVTMNHLDKVDRAVVRPGRFDTILRVGYVHKKADAEQILAKHLLDTTGGTYSGGSYFGAFQWWRLRKMKISAADLCNIIDAALLEADYGDITAKEIKYGITKLRETRAIRAIDSDKD